MEAYSDLVLVRGAGDLASGTIHALAKAGKMNGCLIEGMACPGGCVAGAGTNIPIMQAAKEVQGFQKAAHNEIPAENCGQQDVL